MKRELFISAVKRSGHHWQQVTWFRWVCDKCHEIANYPRTDKCNGAGKVNK